MITALLSVLGMTSATFNATGDFYSTAAYDGFYDANGNLKAYPNGTAANEHGSVVSTGQNPYWANASGNYPLVRLNAGENIDEYTTNQFNMGSAFGLIAIIIGLMALACVAGLRILSTGVAETSIRTLILGTGLLAIWGVFSVLSIGILTAIPVFGAIFYFALSAVYTLGIMQQVAGGHDE